MSTNSNTELTKDERLIAYICRKQSNDPKFGMVKLAKLLWAIDGTSWLRTGTQISSFHYIRQEQGPVPNKRFLDARDRLIRLQILRIVENDVFGLIQKRPTCDIDVPLEGFLANEVETIDSIIDSLQRYNAKDLSNMSHGPAWHAAQTGDELPIYTYICVAEEPTSDEIDFCKHLIT